MECAMQASLYGHLITSRVRQESEEGVLRSVGVLALMWSHFNGMVRIDYARVTWAWHDTSLQL